MKKTICVLLLFAMALSLAVTVGAVEYDMDYEPYSNAIYLVNTDTDTVIYSKNPDGRVYPASTTKIMSAALAMTLCSDLKGTTVTLPQDIGDEFYGIDISNAGLVGGETLSMYDLLHCMLIQSANEAASAVAAYFGRDYFIELMNKKAVELGCTGTHFVNPHGLYDDDHYTTASDMYKIVKWALSVPGFWEITQKARYDLPATNVHDGKTLATTILMQDESSGYYTDYIKGIKTGYVGEASGRCLVSAAQKNGMTFVLVLMGAPSEYTDVFWDYGQAAFNETRVIYDWAFKNLELYNVVDTDTIIDDIKVKYASDTDNMLLYPSGQVTAILDKYREVNPEVEYRTEIPEFVEAPIEAGQAIGKAAVYVDGKYCGDVDLISRQTIELNRFVKVMDITTDILTSTWAMVIYAIIFIIILIYVYLMLVIAAKHKHRRK